MATAIRMLRSGCTAALLALAACETIDQDEFSSEGGMSPDPSAVLEGTVLYIGPRPQCVREPGREPRVIGRVVLTMFEYDNPPPPEGTASSALNLMFVPGESLFSPADCAPEGAPASVEQITRSVAFNWSRIALQHGRSSEYQIRGFYDYDDDMIPLFSVSRLPTKGDIIGAALNDVQDASKGLFKIALPAMEDVPNGARLGGITIALGNVVWTERPAFALDENRALSAEQIFVPALAATGFTPDPVASLRAFRANTCRGGAREGCGLTLRRLASEVGPTLAAARVGLQLDDPTGYAFYSAPVDVETTKAGLDLPVPDGVVDPHPFLGAGLGVPWYGPAVIMQRLPEPGYAAVETEARIPRVLLAPSVLLDEQRLPLRESFAQNGLPIAVPPVAAAELIPGDANCRVPYFAPGTPSLVINGRLANVDELPTGRYAVNLLAGVAGGERVASSAFPDRADSPSTFRDARYSGQSWTVPNELGDPTQLTSTLPDQGLDGAFVVFDPSPTKPQAASTTPNGLCGPEGLVLAENAQGVDSASCLPRSCCDHVVHLCGVARCATVTTANGESISASPHRIVGTGANGAPVPECVPFEMPWQCCRSAP